MDTERAGLLAEAERLGFPFVMHSNGAHHLAGEAQWRSFVENALPGPLRDVAPQLAAHEAQQKRADAFDAREADIDTRRAEAAVPDIEAAAEERLAEVESLARHLAERPARMEAFAARTVELLETLVSRK